MANRRKIATRFGMCGGTHSKDRKIKYRHKHYKCKLQPIPVSKKKSPYNNRLKIYRAKVLKRYCLSMNKRPSTYKQLFVDEHKYLYSINRVSSDSQFKFRIKRVTSNSIDGYRLINLTLLQKYITDITNHVIKCKDVGKFVEQNLDPVKLLSETKTLGLASVLLSECQACRQQFLFETSPKLPVKESNHYDINMRAVWGSMVTGGGVARLNESMATLNAPGMSQPTYCKIEQEIGDIWGKVVDEDLLAAGAEERHIAMEKGDYHEGVPCITVICDGGWSKRSHKHSYNALGGCAVIFGAETGKVLHIGVRNKHCYICNRAEATHTVPKAHRCFKNWNESSQAMEADIILDGFLKAESTHGLRYTKIIADGDSSVYAKLQESVPVWGKCIEKIECANHICKCLRSSLEKLVEENPYYKGKNKITKSVRLRLVSSVRCAIRLRSNMGNRSVASRKLEHDIRNSVHHVFGNHSKCSDFCKAKIPTSSSVIDTPQDDQDGNEEQSIPDVIQGISDVWMATTDVDAQEESRGEFCSRLDLDAIMIRDISILLDRVASKSTRLIGNFTTNLAESWMAVRAKFDGGKLYNRCNRGSWHSRCYGGCLRANLGPQWSPTVWQKTTATRPGTLFCQLYKVRHNALSACKISKLKPEVKARRWKRKMQGNKESKCKKARKEYGPEAVDGVKDLTSEDLEKKKQSFLEKHINLSHEKISVIEKMTKQQSLSGVWIDERKKRLTASNFGAIVRRRPNLPVSNMVKSLLYSNFKGNIHTRKGLQDETMTIKEYRTKKEEDKTPVNVYAMGLVVCKEHKFLAASPDGKVVEKDGTVGLIEIKNLLHSKPINLTEAARDVRSFCLERNNNKLRLRKNHVYYCQVQGLLNVTKLPWLDFVVRTVNPYQLHIERILLDTDIWRSVMLPKLKAFYFMALLPELSAPMNGSISGIREPGVWYKEERGAAVTVRTNKTKKRICKNKPVPKAGHSSSVVNLHLDSKSQDILASKSPIVVTPFGNRPQPASTHDPPPDNTKDQPPDIRYPPPGNTEDQPPDIRYPPPGNTPNPLPGNTADPFSDSTLDLHPDNTTDPSTANRTDPSTANRTDPLPGDLNPLHNISDLSTLHTAPAPLERLNRSRRTPKVKFVGRRISHEWLEDDGVKKWYTGTVIGTVNGKDGQPSTSYDIIYDGEDEPYNIDHLLEDYQSSSVKFIDI